MCPLPWACCHKPVADVPALLAPSHYFNLSAQEGGQQFFSLHFIPRTSITLQQSDEDNEIKAMPIARGALFLG